MSYKHYQALVWAPLCRIFHASVHSRMVFPLPSDKQKIMPVIVYMWSAVIIIGGIFFRIQAVSHEVANM